MNNFWSKWGKYIIYATLLIVIAILITNTTCQRNELKKYKNNEYALRDSLHTVQLKNGDLLSYQQLLILNKKELEEYLNISKKEVKDLEKKLNGALQYIAKIEGHVKVDTIRMFDSIYLSNDSILVYFKYNDDWIVLGGNTKIIDSVPQTTIDSIIMDVPLKVGFAENKLGYEAFVTTDNPYIQFSSIQGAVLEKSNIKTKKKPWNIGLQLGIGGQFGIVHKQFDVGPYIGVGVSYGFNF